MRHERGAQNQDKDLHAAVKVLAQEWRVTFSGKSVN
jgi:hypothetical protein